MGLSDVSKLIVRPHGPSCNPHLVLGVLSNAIKVASQQRLLESVHETRQRWFFSTTARRAFTWCPPPCPLDPLSERDVIASDRRLQKNAFIFLRNTRSEELCIRLLLERYKDTTYPFFVSLFRCFLVSFTHVRFELCHSLSCCRSLGVLANDE